VRTCGTVSEWLQEALTKRHLMIGEVLRDPTGRASLLDVKMTSQTTTRWGERFREGF